MYLPIYNQIFRYSLHNFFALSVFNLFVCINSFTHTIYARRLIV